MDGKNVDKRDSILKLQMDEREKEFTTLQNFKVFVGTFLKLVSLVWHFCDVNQIGDVFMLQYT